MRKYYLLFTVILGGLLIAAAPFSHWIQFQAQDKYYKILDSSGNPIFSWQQSNKASRALGSLTADGMLYANAAASVTGTLTLSGTTSNIALGSNYLSGDGGDEGISVDSTGLASITSVQPSLTFNSTYNTPTNRNLSIQHDAFGSLRFYASNALFGNPITAGTLKGVFNSDGDLSIGSQPLGTAKLTITEGASGLTSVSSGVDTVVLQNNGSVGLTMAMAGATAASIKFASGDANFPEIGGIYYFPSTETLAFRVHATGGSEHTVAIFGNPAGTLGSYFYGDVSALSFTDRTPGSLENPEDEIMAMDVVGDSVDHTTLGSARVTKVNKVEYLDIKAKDGKLIERVPMAMRSDVIVDVTKEIPRKIISATDALNVSTETRMVTKEIEVVKSVSFDPMAESFDEPMSKSIDAPTATEEVIVEEEYEVKTLKEGIFEDSKTGEYYIPASEEVIGQKDITNETILEEVAPEMKAEDVVFEEIVVEEVEEGRDISTTLSMLTQQMRLEIGYRKELEARIAKLEEQVAKLEGR